MRKKIILLIAILFATFLFAEAEPAIADVIAARNVMEDRMKSAINMQKIEIRNLLEIIAQLEKSKTDLEGDVFIRSKTREIDRNIEIGRSLLSNAETRLLLMQDYRTAYMSETIRIKSQNALE